MAAIVTGLIPIQWTAVDATTIYKILLLAELPFTKLDADFTCNSTRDSICTRACFNKHFHKPMMVAWNFICVLVILSVLFMELFASHLRSLAQKRSFQMKIDGRLEAQGKEEAQVVCKDTRGKTVIDLQRDRDRGTVGFYLLSITLHILVEA